MKKFLFAACALTAATVLQANAQEDEGFHVGLNSGYYYNLMVDQSLFDSETYDHGRTWNMAPIGLTAGYQWGRGIGVQVEVIKAKLGQDFDIRTRSKPAGDFVVTGNKSIEMDYIQVPILFKLQSGDSKVRFSFVLGPQISFLTKASDIEAFDVPAQGANYAYNNAINYTNTNDVPVTVVSGREYVIGSTDDGALYKFNKTAIGAVLGLGVDAYVHDNIYISAMLRLGYNFTELREEGEGGQKFVDNPILNTGNIAAPNRDLYEKDARNMAFGGLQLGVHYIFGK